MRKCSFIIAIVAITLICLGFACAPEMALGQNQGRKNLQLIITEEYAIEVEYSNIMDFKTSVHYTECAVPTIIFPKKYGTIINQQPVRLDDKGHRVLDVVFVEEKTTRIRTFLLERIPAEGTKLLKDVQLKYASPILAANVVQR